ncbi:MAG: lipopolysaccharide biosynthesis protein [Proteobacteria bacterium SG_bin9]|nr:MAG: lipopolysaccharide biosynthesis protein [Proteobacteria bacterium SG_bin9]
MRLAFWRRSAAKPAEASSAPVAVAPAVVAPPTPPKPVPAVQAAPPPAPEAGDLDLRAIWALLLRKKFWIIGPTLAALALSIFVVNSITPRYKSEARILIDGRENIFLRPNGERAEERTALDAEAVTSQVQLLLSREVARSVIAKNNLEKLPEFDPVLRGISPVRSLLALFGLARDPFRMTPEERVLDAYYERLQAFAVDKSRVMVVEFQSRDPDLAARVANSIADEYLIVQQGARQNQARSASQWLSGEIDNLRNKVADAEAKAEDFRSKSSLFIGTNNTTLSNQQLGELNTQLNTARALKSDAESKARLIREALQTGRPIEASEVLNSELVRRLSEQRVTLRAQLAEQSSTLLDGHPRIKEIRAQIADLDRQLREEAGKLSRSFESDAKIAAGRVDGLTANLEQLKRQATSTNGQDVQLRALEREAKAQRDLLESYLAKFREANARENIDTAPADGRIISRAIVSNTPAYPKKLPIVLIATLATLMLTSGYFATGELLRMTAPRAGAAPRPVAQPVLQQPMRDTHPELAVAVPEIEQLAAELRASGNAQKITMLGAGQNESITLTSLTLARLLARNAKVVLVDLSAASPTLNAVSTDPAAPGISDLAGGEASFGQIITKDRLSGLHLISAGRYAVDRGRMASPRIGMAIDALMQVYDHVLIDAGTASDMPAQLLTSRARAIVVPAAATDASFRTSYCDQLRAIGFERVTMLSRPPETNDNAPRVVAA